MRAVSLGRLLSLPCLLLFSCHNTDPVALQRSDWTAHAQMLPAECVTVPLIVDAYGLAYVDVTLENTGPFRLLLDTGTYGLLLAADVAERLPSVQHPDAHAFMEGIGGQAVPAERVIRVGTLAIGSMQCHFFNAFVARREALVLTHDVQHDGILGMGVLRDVLITIDLPREQLTLSRGTLSPDAPFSTPLTNAPQDVPKVTMHLSGPSSDENYLLQAVLDTGANVTHLPTAARGWPITSHYLGQGVRREIGQRPLSSKKYRLETELVLGDTGCRIVNPVVYYAGVEGRVGLDVLSQMIVVLDAARRRVALVPNEHRDRLTRLRF